MTIRSINSQTGGESSRPLTQAELDAAAAATAAEATDPNIVNPPILMEIKAKEEEAIRGIIELNVSGRGNRTVSQADKDSSANRIDTVYDELLALRSQLVSV